MKTSLFESKHLYFTKLQKVDFSPFFEMQSDPKVMRYTNFHAQNKQECKDDFEKVFRNYELPDPDLLVWGAYKKSVNQMVGTVAIIKNDKNENEIGYRLLRKYWKLGFGYEMADALCKYCFEKRLVKDIVAYASPENPGSVKILEKLGFISTLEFINHKLKCKERRYYLKPG